MYVSKALYGVSIVFESTLGISLKSKTTGDLWSIILSVPYFQVVLSHFIVMTD